MMRSPLRFRTSLALSSLWMIISVVTMGSGEKQSKILIGILDGNLANLGNLITYYFCWALGKRAFISAIDWWWDTRVFILRKCQEARQVRRTVLFGETSHTRSIDAISIIRFVLSQAKSVYHRLRSWHIMSTQHPAIGEHPLARIEDGTNPLVLATPLVHAFS